MGEGLVKRSGRSRELTETEVISEENVTQILNA